MIRLLTCAGMPGRFGLIDASVPSAWYVGRIERRDVNALDPGGLLEKKRPAVMAAVTAFPVQIHQFADHLLAFADHDEVEEVGHRLDVEDDRSAGDNQRIIHPCGRP